MEWFVLLFVVNLILFLVLPLKYLYIPNTFSVFAHVALFILYMKWRPKESATFKHLFNKFVNFKFVATNVPDQIPERRILYACHPHGVYAVSLIGFFPFHMENVQVAVSSILFRLPLVKDFCCLIGIKTTVKREQLLEALKETSVAMCPGGLRELLTHDKWVKRKGFIKLAKEAGAHICLVHCKNENDTYSVYIFSWLYPMQNWVLRKFLYPFPIFSWSGLPCPFWPRYLKDGMRLEFGHVIDTQDKSVDEIYKELYEGET